MGVERVVRAGAFGLSIAISSVGHAQPQDDAALANVPEDKPRAPARPGSPWPSLQQPRAPVTASVREPEAQPEPEPTFTTEELRQRFPDLQLRNTHPPTLTFGLGSVYPFQAFALGVGFDVYALPRLRLSVVGSLGATPIVNEKWRFSVYADVAVGVVLLRSSSQAFAHLPMLSPRPRRSTRSTFERALLGEEPPPTIRAQVPSAHSLELAAGAFTGLYSLYRCTAHCDEDPVLVEHSNEDASLQTTFLYAGLRYVYYRWASSEQASFRSVGAFEAEVDALTNPFTPHAVDVFNIYEEHPAYNPVGVRVILRIPTIKCAAKGPCFGLDLMGGYLPSPADATFSINALLW
jgi:hypothetical protein